MYNVRDFYIVSKALFKEKNIYNKTNKSISKCIKEIILTIKVLVK